MRYRAGGIFAVLSLFLLTAASSRPGPAPAPPRPNILLIVLDTLRADATSIVKPDANKTPFLASLAARGTVFTRAYSTHDFTPPSHFSIMTGLRDGLGTNDDRAENGVPYQLAVSGYDTFAVAANNLIGIAQMPVHRAFKRFKQPGNILGETTVDALGDTTDIDMRLRLFRCNPTPHARLSLYYSAERLLPIVLEEMRTSKGPYFGFVNLLDTHEPYIPDPAFYPPEKSLPPNFEGDVMARRLGPALTNPDAGVQALIKTVKFPRLVAADLSPETLAIYRARYDATVRELDDTLKKFFAQLDREKLLDDTVVIITSDHGESFGEGGFLTHMLGDRGDYESTHHVPMLVVLPKRFARPAARIDQQVSIADLAPTIYDLAGVDWSPLPKRYPQYAKSLLPMMGASAQPAVARVALPAAAPQDMRLANEEREKVMRSLGYLQ